MVHSYLCGILSQFQFGLGACGITTGAIGPTGRPDALAVDSKATSSMVDDLFLRFLNNLK